MELSQLRALTKELKSSQCFVIVRHKNIQYSFKTHYGKSIRVKGESAYIMINSLGKINVFISYNSDYYSDVLLHDLYNALTEQFIVCDDNEKDKIVKDWMKS